MWEDVRTQPGDVLQGPGGVSGAFDHEQQPAGPGGEGLGEPLDTQLRRPERVEVQQVLS